MVARGYRQLVIDAATTVGIAVDQHDNMLEGNSRQHVIEAMNVLCHQVTVTVEGIVMCTHRCIAPNTQVRHAGSSGEGLSRHSDDIEAILH